MFPSVEIVFPDNEGKEDLEFSVKMENESKFYLSGNHIEKFTPAANLAKTFALDSYRDNRKDITKEMNRMQQNLNYRKSLLQFSNSLIDDIISIINAETSINDSELSYERMSEDYNTDIKTGNLTVGSMLDLEWQLSLESHSKAIENQKSKYQSQLNSFYRNYGFLYETVDSVRECNLEINYDEIRNTELLISEKAMEIARQNYDAEIGIARKLKVGGNVNTPIVWEKNKDTNVTVNGSVSATISGPNYSFGTRVGTEYYVSNNRIYPYVTINGKWSNKNTKQSDNLEAQTLKNKMIIAEMDYQNVKEEFETKVKSFSDDIDNFNADKNQLEIRTRYNSYILEKAEEMYSLGLISKRELEDAEIEVQKDKKDKIILYLNGIKLENNIKIFEL